MASRKITAAEADGLEASIPAPIANYSKNAGLVRLDDIFQGSEYDGVREAIKTRGVANWRGNKIAADFDKNGNVVAMAAIVSRTPVLSETFLRENVPDFFALSTTPTTTDYVLRRQRMALFHQVADREGVINNAIKKTASLISQDGAFKVRAVRQGKRPTARVVEDLTQLLLHWAENVNADDFNATITGSRGLRQILRRGGRQAMIEGDLFLRQVWVKVNVPTLDNKEYKLPMALQAIPSQDIFVPYEVVGTGMEVFYWRPSPIVYQTILYPSDSHVKKIVDKLVLPQIRKQLATDGKVYLDPRLLIHVKHGGTDTDIFGKSMVEPAMTDLAYSRSLKMLDFVTIESLINRMLVIKIGDKDPKSEYHNLAVAQQRVGVFRKLINAAADDNGLGPNQVIVWAGHDIEKLDIGAHDTLLDTTPRQKQAMDGVKTALGVPDSVLLGSAEGASRGVGWLGFIALATVAEELQEEFGQVLTQLGRRIAKENGFEDVDLVWEFNRSLLADKEANAKVMLQAYDRGVLSKRSLAEELGKDYDAERGRKEDEKENGDDDLFVPPMLPLGGPGGIQGPGAGSQPGRPANKGNPSKIGPERDNQMKPNKNE